MLGLAVLCVMVSLLVGTASAHASSFGATAWGGNEFGQLGDETTGKATSPTTVSIASEVTAVSAGSQSTYFLLANGTVWATGSNFAGQLGNGTTTDSKVPVEVSGLTEVVAISGGDAYALALRKDGTVWAWGTNEYGQLGDGTTTSKHAPVKVSGLSEVVAISAGAGHSLAALTNEHVEAWGLNASGELGTGTHEGPEKCKEGSTELACSKTPVEVSELTEASSVASGFGHSLALLKGGEVRAWGENFYGQLCDGSTTESDVPVSVSGITNATQVAAPGNYSLLLLSSGKVKACGVNYHGQLGDGTTVNRETPVEVSGISSATAIAGGEFEFFGATERYGHSLALLSSGKVEAWGANEVGQLGDGTTKERHTPVEVINLTEVAGISGGILHSVALEPPGPTVASLTPSSGFSNVTTPVEIEGKNFTGATSVKFGSSEAAFTVNSATSITAEAPPGKPGSVAVTVTTGHGTNVAGTAPRFTYVPPGSLEFGRCVKGAKGSGEYKDAACTELGGEEKFAWHPGVLKPKVTASGGAATIEDVAKHKITCTAESASGEYSGVKQLVGAIKLTGCELVGTGKCSSTGAAEGELVSGTLEGVIGFQDKETNKVGLELSGAAEHEVLVEASCAGKSVVIKGAVIAPITTVNKMSSTFKLKYKATAGKQSPEHFEGESNAVLSMSINGGASEQAGLTLESTVTNEEEVELNTVV